MEWSYSIEKNIQVVLGLLKKHNIKKVIASPGTINLSLVASMMHDTYFEIISCVDERSAAYMACGIAAETKEPVVLSCTGATASRNYVPGLTEAFYRKLPVIAITSTTNISRIGHLHQQMLDRTAQFNDLVKISVQVPVVNSSDDLWFCNIQVNKALTECRRNGGNPVHLNLETRDLTSFKCDHLKVARPIYRITHNDDFPILPNKSVIIYIGSHVSFSQKETDLIDEFCRKHNSAVICEHGSGFKGAFETSFSLIGSQEFYNSSLKQVGLIIHIGEIAADCDYGSSFNAEEVWRVSEDGEIKDPTHKLSYVFEMNVCEFFTHYKKDTTDNNTGMFEAIEAERKSLLKKIDVENLPFSNIWLAINTSYRLPENSVLHLGILNSFRSWNFFQVPKSVRAYCNAGGYGIDGCVSTMLGASLCSPNKLYFGVFGDLAFFYDMNSIGNRYIRNNVRILIVNNGKGTEFKNYYHPWSKFGDNADLFGAAACHFGNKSEVLVKHYSEDLGFEYISASNKEEYLQNVEMWLNPRITDKPILFEVFTNSQDESNALYTLRHLVEDKTLKAKTTITKAVAKSLGSEKTRVIKDILNIL